MPSLANIISDLSPGPWRLSDFTTYLSRNHCLENLQFVQDASRYCVCYAEVAGGNRTPQVSLRCHDDYLQALWKGLLGAYILPNGHREVNLPSKVRDRLLVFRSSDFLPHPSELDDALEIIHQLMEDSILPGFLNSRVSLEQPGDRGCGDWNGISGRLRRKISTSSLYWDHGKRVQVNEPLRLRASSLGGDGGDTFCAPCHFVEGAAPSPRSHLLRRTIEVFDLTVRGVWGMGWLKLPLGKDGAADVEMGTEDQYVSAKPLERARY
ncbi:RGS domain-containing protein [Dactylonectria estremocensis]|uniref:RGS domain-containing protein n=1 Tax=Dactylonectria estremocensis TaxID=1079267 RepID=A0A9P9DA64_9HYPO|nr:RGS domain-containing protein [Dactylonectria estremocensis]